MSEQQAGDKGVERVERLREQGRQKGFGVTGRRGGGARGKAGAGGRRGERPGGARRAGRTSPLIWKARVEAAVEGSRSGRAEPSSPNSPQ